MVRIDRLSSASKTLLLPLYYRAVESRRPDAIIADPLAADLVKTIAFDFTPLAGRNFDRVVAMLRAAAFDRITRDFIRNLYMANS